MTDTPMVFEAQGYLAMSISKFSSYPDVPAFRVSCKYVTAQGNQW